MPDWNPDQYRQFAAERAQPFHDLLALVEPGSIKRAVDLGCGPGELTALAAEQLGIDEIVGIDNSRAMLDKTAEHSSDHVRFEHGDIAEWTSTAGIDLVLAAASLQWVPDHAGVIRAGPPRCTPVVRSRSRFPRTRTCRRIPSPD